MPRERVSAWDQHKAVAVSITWTQGYIVALAVSTHLFLASADNHKLNINYSIRILASGQTNVYMIVFVFFLFFTNEKKKGKRE